MVGVEVTRGRWRLWHLCAVVAAAGVICALVRTDLGPMALTVALAAVATTGMIRPVYFDLWEVKAKLVDHAGERRSVTTRIGKVIVEAVLACTLALIWLLSCTAILAVLLLVEFLVLLIGYFVRAGWWLG